jgi:hypothetical protein
MKLLVIIILQILFNFVKCYPYKLYEHINNRYRFFSTATVYKYVSPVVPFPESSKYYYFKYSIIIILTWWI